jgi:small subunit ribosomal protein S6
MRTYEVLFILSPQVPEEEATALSNEFRGIAEKTGATLKNEEAWGRRRLAYPIQKFNEGNYHLFVFESDGSLAELDRRMKNSDRILRHMIVRTDEDLKRADKLAKRNPKKERVRPVTPSTATSPAAEPAPEAPAAPEGV